jgi:hypothetical protein
MNPFRARFFVRAFSALQRLTSAVIPSEQKSDAILSESAAADEPKDLRLPFSRIPGNTLLGKMPLPLRQPAEAEK